MFQKPGRYRKCIVVVEKIFRGLRYPELIEIFKVSFKPDYRLIPKEEEDLWYKRAIECEKYIPSFLPTHVTVPPTLKVLKFVIFLSPYIIVFNVSFVKC